MLKNEQHAEGSHRYGGSGGKTTQRQEFDTGLRVLASEVCDGKSEVVYEKECALPKKRMSVKFVLKYVPLEKSDKFNLTVLVNGKTVSSSQWEPRPENGGWGSGPIWQRMERHSRLGLGNGSALDYMLGDSLIPAMSDELKKAVRDCKHLTDKTALQLDIERVASADAADSNAGKTSQGIKK